MAWQPDPANASYFRPLTDEQEKEFRQYAKENDPPPGAWDILHPVCREEWEKRGIHDAGI